MTGHEARPEPPETLLNLNLNRNLASSAAASAAKGVRVACGFMCVCVSVCLCREQYCLQLLLLLSPHSSPFSPTPTHNPTHFAHAKRI